MSDIIIDEEFRNLLPALDSERYAMLEESLLQFGCVYPLVLWNGILIDGYTRHRIAMEHGIPFTTIEKEFGCRDEVLIWIVSAQISMRSLSDIHLSYLRGLHYIADMRKHGLGDRLSDDSEKAQNEPLQDSSASRSARLAKLYNVSPSTIKREAEVAEAICLIVQISPLAKRKILSKAIRVTRTLLRELLTWEEEDVQKFTISIEEGIL